MKNYLERLLITLLFTTILNAQDFSVNSDNFLDVLKRAQNGDTLNVESEINIPNNYDSNYASVSVPGVTINGNGHTVHLVGRPLSLTGDTTFKNVNLSLLLPNSEVPNNDATVLEKTAPIYANGYDLIFDNVTTNVAGKPNNQPTIIMGNEKNGVGSGRDNKFEVKNQSSELKLKTIIAGSKEGDKVGKSTIILPDKVTLKSNGSTVVLKNLNGSSPLDVEIENKSRNVRTFDAGNNPNVKVTIEDVKYDVGTRESEFKGKIKEITLKNGAELYTDDKLEVGKLVLTSNNGNNPKVTVYAADADDDTGIPAKLGELAAGEIDATEAPNATVKLDGTSKGSVDKVIGNFKVEGSRDSFTGYTEDNSTTSNNPSDGNTSSGNDTGTSGDASAGDNSNGGSSSAPSVDEPNNQDGGSPTENNDNTAVAPTEPTNPTTDTTSTDGNTANDGTANEPNTPIEPKDDVDNSSDTDANSSNGDKPDEPNANSSGNTTDSTTEVDNSTSGSTDSNNEAEKPSETSEEKNEEKQPEVVKEKEKELPKARIILNGDISRVLSNIMEENYYILENNTKDGIWLSGLTNINKFGNTYKVENNAIVVGYNKTNYGLGFSYNKLKIEDKIDEIKSDLFTTYGNAKLKIENNVFFLTTSLGVNKSRIGNNILFGNKVMYGHEIDFNSIKITPMIELKHLLIKEKGYEIPEIKAKINPKTINYLSTMIGTRVSYENDNLKLFTQFGFDMNMKNKNEIRTLTVDGVPHININEKMDPITKEFIFGAEYEIIKNLNMGLNYKGRHQDSKLSNTFNFSIKYSF